MDLKNALDNTGTLILATNPKSPSDSPSVLFDKTKSEILKLNHPALGNFKNGPIPLGRVDDDNANYMSSFGLVFAIHLPTAILHNPDIVFIPIEDLPLTRVLKESIVTQYGRVHRMYVQNQRYMSMSNAELGQEMKKHNLDLKTKYDNISCCICSGLEWYEARKLDDLDYRPNLRYHELYDTKSGNTMAIMVFNVTEAPEHIHIDLFCANQKIKSAAARLLFSIMLKTFEERNVSRITLDATAAGQPFYASFGFVGGYEMELRFQ